MRKITLILTLALLIVALAAGMALAAPANEIWVDEEQIWNGTIANNNAVNGVSYEPSTQTLTLDGAHITKGYKYFDNGTYAYYAGIYADGDLKIVLRGSNSIKLQSILAYDGIYVDGALTVSGSGSLDITAGYYGLYADNGDITVSDSTVNVNSYYYGIYAEEGSIIIDRSKMTVVTDSNYGLYADEGNISISDSTLLIDGCSYGIYMDDGIWDGGKYVSDGHITITDSDITITDCEYGIYAYEGNVTVTDSELTITSEYEGIAAYGIWEDNTHICNGDITITDSELTINADYYGLDGGGDITITDSWVKIITGEYGYYGISANGIIDISNSYVYAEGGRGGIISWYTDSVGIVHEGVIIKQGGKVVEIWGPPVLGAAVDRSTGLATYGQAEQELLGYAFSETHQRIMREWSPGDDMATYPGISQTVEMVPTAEVMQLVVPILGGVGKNFPFVDVGLNHWAYNDIFDAFKKGLINGKTETLYLPDGPLTYAEAIKLAACIHQLNSMGAVSFEPSDPWYQTYVSYAELNEIILPGEFAGKYNDAIIRYDFAHIFGKALPVSAFTPINSIDSIPDVPSSNRHADEILMLYRAGILVGSDAAGTFNGNSNIKRSEVAAIVVRMIDPEKRIRK